jgi:lysophospholipase L1-like esterase
MNILFIGDSLIEYLDWQERIPDHTVTNLGVAGESVQGLLSRIVIIKDVCSDADFIFIMSGINNVAMGDNDFIDFYKVIIEKLSGLYPDARIFINSLLPVSVDFISNELIQRTNEFLKVLADKMNVLYLDIYRKFIDTKGMPINEYLLEDGVHLSRVGYAVWSRVLEEVIVTK